MVRITQIVEQISSGIFKIAPRIVTKITLKTTVNPAGMDLLNTFCINLPFTLSLFGSKAKMKEGIPIHTREIRLSCIGIKGYLSFKKTNKTAKRLE